VCDSLLGRVRDSLCGVRDSVRVCERGVVIRVKSKPCDVGDSKCVTLCYVEFVSRYVEFVTVCV